MGILFLAMSEFCQRLNYADLAAVGRCLNEVTLQGDVMLGGILLTVMFVGLIIRYNFPLGMILPFAMALTFTMWLMTGAAGIIFLGLFMLTVIIGGALLIIGLLKYINR